MRARDKSHADASGVGPYDRRLAFAGGLVGSVSSGEATRPGIPVLRRYGHLIAEGEIRTLEQVPFHRPGPFVRWQMAGRGVHDEPPFHVAVHAIDESVDRMERDYCQLHEHDFHELNVLLSSGKLIYRIVLGDESYEVSAPASILIPPHVPHSANVVEGSGLFIAILACSTYEASVASKPPLERERERAT